MTFALAKEIPTTGKYEVSCASCLSPVGVMDVPTIMRAISSRGPIICPECRSRKCDYCGKVMKRRLPFVGHSLNRICTSCVRGKKHLTPPAMSRDTQIRMKYDSERQLYYLSCSPKLHKTGGDPEGRGTKEVRDDG